MRGGVVCLVDLMVAALGLPGELEVLVMALDRD